jgi:hypothetical protein
VLPHPLLNYCKFCGREIMAGKLNGRPHWSHIPADGGKLRRSCYAAAFDPVTGYDYSVDKTRKYPVPKYPVPGLAD